MTPLASRFPSPEQSPGFMLWHLTHAWQRTIRAALTPHDLIAQSDLGWPHPFVVSKAITPPLPVCPHLQGQPIRQSVFGEDRCDVIFPPGQQRSTHTIDIETLVGSHPFDLDDDLGQCECISPSFW